MRLIVGTRGSKLSLIQTKTVIQELRKKIPKLEIKVKIIETTGDQKIHDSLISIEEKGMFEKEIDEAVNRGDVDFAVHSMKDVPTLQPTKSTIVAVPERQSPYDVLVSRKHHGLSDLLNSSIIGTGSPRRMAQLHNMRADLEVKSIRGNVDTRLKKLDQGLYDAIIIAEAGLQRLNMEDRITERLSFEEFTPSAGQGALAVVANEDNDKVVEILKLVNHQPSMVSIIAEREFIKEIGGGCKVPLGAVSQIQNDKLLLNAVILTPDGKSKIQLRKVGDCTSPDRLGHKTAKEMLEMGAKHLIECWRYSNDRR